MVKFKNLVSVIVCLAMIASTIPAIAADAGDTAINGYDFKDGLQNATEFVPAPPFAEKISLTTEVKEKIKTFVVLNVDWCNAYLTLPLLSAWGS